MYIVNRLDVLTPTFSAQRQNDDRHCRPTNGSCVAGRW